MLVRKEYRETSDSHDVQTLVRLDSRMRNILEARTPGLCDDDRGLQTQEQETFGLRLGYWEELGYDGLLLSEAHAIDPQSRWRPYTLYSTLQDDALAPSTLGHAPDIAAARNYLDEFPQGPFA